MCETTLIPWDDTSLLCNVDCLKLLIDAGANINETNSHNESPLLFASKCTNVGAVKVLIQAGANVNKISYQGESPLLVAARDSNIHIVKMLVETGADVNYVGYMRSTPFHFAAWLNTPAVIRVIYTHGGVRDLEKKNMHYEQSGDELRYTPLELAAMGSNLAAVQEVVKLGASVPKSILNEAEVAPFIEQGKRLQKVRIGKC